MKFKITRDTNGNQVVKVTNGKTSFTVQTNGNLPATHQAGRSFEYEETRQEIANYIAKFGTPRQIAIFNS